MQLDFRDQTRHLKLESDFFQIFLKQKVTKVRCPAECLMESSKTPLESNPRPLRKIQICCEDTFEPVSFQQNYPEMSSMETLSYMPFYGLVRVLSENVPELLRTREFIDWGHFDSWTACHALGGCLGFIQIELNECPDLANLHKILLESRQVIRIEDIAIPTDFTHCLILAPGKKSEVFLLYALKRNIPGRELLPFYRLALIIGLEYNLVRYYDLENLPPREAEIAMLTTFDRIEKVTLPGGRIVEATSERSLLYDLESRKTHKTLQLHAKEGNVVFTKVPVAEDKVKSYIVHIRPGWDNLKAYLVQKKEANHLFRIHPVAKEAEGLLALELWRILDPDHSLIDRNQLPQYLIHSSPEKNNLPKTQDIFEVLKRSGKECDIDLTICLDSSSRWTNSPELVWPLRFFEPYVSGVDSCLSVALHVLHQLRNEFFEGCDRMKKELETWQIGTTPPTPPNLLSIFSKIKHRWLQEFQAPQHKAISDALANARDYADPALRNKYHLVVDTNVFLSIVDDSFELIEVLRHVHSHQIVIVVPYATIQELDWQKHRDEVKKLKSQACIKFINGLANTSFLVIQSMEEDAPSFKLHCQSNSSSSVQTTMNAQNDLRILDCAKTRYMAGLKTMMVTGDTNLRNMALSNNIPAIRSQSLWLLVSNPRFVKLSPDHWVDAISNMERSKGSHTSENEVTKKARINNDG